MVKITSKEFKDGKFSHALINSFMKFHESHYMCHECDGIFKNNSKGHNCVDVRLSRLEAFHDIKIGKGVE